MRRFVFVCAALLLILASCAPRGAESRSLKVENGMRCSVTFNGNDRFAADIKKTTDGEIISLLSPECVSGVSFVRRGGEYYLEVQGTDVDLPDALLPKLAPLFDVVSLPDESEEAEGGFTVRTDEGTYTVTLNGEKPESISFEGKRDFKITKIELY